MYRFASALLNPEPIWMSVSAAGIGACAFSCESDWNCCVNAAPHCSLKPSYSTPSTFGTSNTLRPRASWWRKYEIAFGEDFARFVSLGADVCSSPANTGMAKSRAVARTTTALRARV